MMSSRVGCRGRQAARSWYLALQRSKSRREPYQLHPTNVNNIGLRSGAAVPRTGVRQASGNIRSGADRWQPKSFGASGGGKGGGWRQNGSFTRSARNFQERVPVPWLIIACISLVDYGSNAYVVATEDFTRLMQRCRFQIAAAAVDDVTDLSALYDLLDWVYESVDAVGPSCLPKLLDADVIAIVLSGAQSANLEMSTLCFEILSVLSTNEHVAETMARDPALRSTLVDEVNRIFGWQWSESAPTDSAPSDSAPSDSGFGSGGVDGSSAGEPPAQRCPGQTRGRTVHAVTERLNSHIQRQYPREPGFALLGGFGTGVGGSDGADGFGRRGGKKELGQFGQRVDSSRDEDLTDGTADQEPGIEGLSGGSGQDSDATADAAAADAADAAGGTISLDPIYAAIALQTLGNVMRARRKATQPPKPVTEAWDDMAIAFFPEGTRLPWPLDLLYGGNDWSGADGSAATAAASPPREAPVEWSLDKKVVGDLAEVMLSINPREIRVDGGHPEDGDSEELSEVDHAGSKMALRRLEFALASVLREASSHPDLVGLVMRRRPVGALVTLTWQGHSLNAKSLAVKATRDICAEYRRLHGLPKSPDHVPKGNDALILTEWTKKHFGEEDIDSNTVDPTLGEADMEFVLEAEQSIHPGTVSNAIYGMVICDTVVSVAFLWGVLRRYVAWRQAGETFSALSKLALPRALLFGGLRAAVGAAALTLTHSPLGFRSHMRYQTLDATNGSRGTLAMNGARDALDLGYLYLLIRWCPYALLPAIVVNSVYETGPALNGWRT